MTARTPKEVVELYNYELWNKQNYEIGAEIIADTVTRYYPGETKILTREESLQRVRDTYQNIYSKCLFTLPLILVDGEYVTMAWDMQATPISDQPETPSSFSSIEIFRVVDGQITEAWNPAFSEGSTGFWRQ